mmetsp:Transcript_121872/g.389749  ORF Transcript_121872/g.389749 Transcript_121872/m.389749 type:complete len:84 (+) Transcript_121872:96-347(+)|eukprot:CAMPEP_0203919696 /NCGR_PEP_ID=MMETSP0359-20131031/60074_1 /ASSEMBLY_ACC=CAM_ASM_000338 /TAXON_ID=268821 /ORGANISM="Scrippsiella Hangoei, Strain SHTV-5" /LENGTH=83 /DNA_ID=CAMNT_0050847047 /DNA_START=68 /DNA_END=319 /DNA_ORIENTATION=-
MLRGDTERQVEEVHSMAPRRRGFTLPIPLLQRAVVQMSESGKGYTLGKEYPVFREGLPAILAPPAFGIAFCILVSHMLRTVSK